MLTPEYLFHVTEGAEKITSDMHKNIMDMIVERRPWRRLSPYGYGQVADTGVTRIRVLTGRHTKRDR